MAKSKASELVRGAGMAADVWTRLAQEVKNQGGQEEDLHLLARDEGRSLIVMIAGLLVRAGAAVRNLYKIVVDYSMSLANMILAGDYGYVNPNITAENFPVQGEGAIELDGVLVHFNRDIESDDAVKEMDQMGLRPATMAELLAFGAKFPEIQREFPIVGLGHSWMGPRGFRSVGYLDFWYGGRRVCLDRWAGAWDAFYRFLGVRKSKPLDA